mmetsp:Transcript_59903/g.106548  ORF Transcript_59903/g.106548 Transcript_59903/m.106548 type:complete len:522 (-) Transcript_59903:122-1687(-)|eukprot:CAMPEP_0197655780 /NCGR_PEP_ID=MMETSP1338-20131121/39659_1 /TAXON_ID=43686 ORGANISM="Pelagodinium beii, Strain RCC1491" /NCGR_SAMPLE_ID=MMETSP1338 /ASSEMBLY_ACC=CAM_ASM_000754 /LENGTH=521 /DNA_ID=CAMNT_0043231495 /DNA_START=105 /DNA_END=1670 /DNA_ORIENTATION=+
MSEKETFLTGAPSGDDDFTQLGDTQPDLAMDTTTEGGAFRVAGLAAASSSARPLQNEALSARKIELINDAKMRAEHQEQARVTMLNLAQALDEASVRRRELEHMVVKEQQLSEKLRVELAGWQPKLDKALAEIDVWKQRTMNKEIECSLYERPFLPFLTWWAIEYRPLGERKSAVPGVRLSEEEAGDVDRLTLRSMLRSWKSQSRGSTALKVMAAKHAEEVQLLKSQLKSEREEHAKLLDAEKKRVQELEEKLAGKDEEIMKVERRLRQVEEEKIALMDKIEAAEARHKAEVDELKRQLAEVPALLAEKDAAYALLLKALKEAEEAVLRAKADAEAEIAALKARILELAEELRKSLGLARHLKETATKAKREATGCISPEKFAQLIVELEELRDKLGNIGTSKDSDKDALDALKLKLGQNRRRMELERQFLPLLHKVNGPVGPQNRSLKKKPDPRQQAGAMQQLDNMVGPNGVPLDPRMRHSRSAGGIDMSGQAGDRGNPMASTTGFAGFGGGSTGQLRGI